ncbi:hypothetical protein C8F01DRAFT_1220406 [Mycena amicta]|nr:hypothetical protein C8F01DRAFT_1220406 [Mycena amicta]
MVEDDAASTKSALTLPSVREGPARLKECGRRRFFSHDGWLKLNNAELSFSSSHKFGRRSLVLPLTHIDTLERTVLVSSGLVLKTKFGDRFLLKFATERELYDWQDAICLRTNRIGLPYNVAHNHHGTLDPETGTLRGLPVAWDRVDRTLPKKSARGFPETSSLASSSAADITSILRVRFDTLSEPLGNGALVSTHIAVTQTTALLGVLERACGTRNVHPADHALSLDNLRPLPNDTTVAELGGQLDLSLIKRVYTAADEVTIRVCLKLSPDEIHIGDLSIAPNMRIFDVRQLICSQRKLIAETYLVAVSGSVEFLSMNSLVWDLHGRHNLVLIKRLRAGASLSN